MDSKYKGILIIIFGIILAYLMINPTSNYERIDIVGSTSVQPVAEKLADSFVKKHPDIKINVQGGGSGMGIRSTEQGIADIGMSSKEISNEELNNISTFEIGKEGIVVAVSKDNNISNLETEDIKNIFNGKVNNWKELGGKDEEIHVITREEGSGTRSAFESIVMDDTKIKDDAIVQSSTESVKQSVSSNPGAIGFVSLAHMSNDVNALSINGIYPSEKSVSTGEYELQRPFLFLFKGETAIIKEFLDWIKSPEGTKIIEEEKIIPS